MESHIFARSRILYLCLPIIVTIFLTSIAVPVWADFTLTIYEQTGSISTYTFNQNDPRVFTDLAGLPGPVTLGYSGYDFGTGGCEYYDIFFCDFAGVALDIGPGDPLPPDIFFKLECWDISCNDGQPVGSPGWAGAGNNIDAVVLDMDGQLLYGQVVVEEVYGLCQEPFNLKDSNFADEALGPPDAGITKMGGGWTVITLYMGPAPSSDCEVVVNYPHSETTYYIGGQHTIDILPNTCSSSVSLELYKADSLLCHITDITGRWYEWYGVSDCGGGPGTDYRIKATCLSDPACFDFSDYFAMAYASGDCEVVVNYPHSGTTYYIGGQHSIDILPNTCSSLVSLELYKGEAPLCHITDITGRWYEWYDVSDCGGGPGWDYRIKATCLSNPACYDFSDYFAMLDGASSCEIDVNYPHAATTFYIGGQHTIDITPDGCGSEVSLELFRGITRLCHIADISGTSYDWSGVSDCGSGPGADYRIKATCLADSGCFDFSEFFTMVEGTGGCEVVVNYPDSGATLHIGGQYMIDVMPNTCDTEVRLELFKGDLPLCQIADMSGRWYEWDEVSDCGGGPGADYRIRATCLSDPGCYDFSDYFAMADQETTLAALEHDPLVAIGDPYFDWIQNGIGWVTAEGGYVFGNVAHWLDALISEKSFESSDEPVLVFRVFNSIGASNFMGGFTSALPPLNDYHYDNIEIGIYLHSTGTIRPTWSVNNDGYWSTTLDAGFDHIKIALDESAGTVMLAIDDVASWSSPLSDFAAPVWSSVESRTIGGPYHIQINPANEGSRVYDVWASGTGFTPPPPPAAAPHILFVEDVGNDEGRQVRMKWQASSLDILESAEPVTGYALWRRIDPLPEWVTVLSVPAPGPVPMYPPGDWDYLGTLPACCEETYAMILPTLADSTDAYGMHWSVFFVRALTETPGIYFDSPPDSGWSVDNLAPAPAAGFSGVENIDPPGLLLYWEPGTEPDILCYDVHNGVAEDFIPDGSNLVGSTADTEMFVTGWTPADQYFYKIIAVDDSGNRGPAAVLRPENIYVGTYLQSFSTAWRENCIEISWTLSEVDEAVEFIVLRAEDPGRIFEEIDGASIERDGMRFVLKDLSYEPGSTYIYRVELEEESGRRTLFETDEISSPALPLTLFQNVPNPFNPSTSIGFYLPETCRVRVDIYDVTGRHISTLLDETRSGGSHTVEWNGVDRTGTQAASGVYFYRLVAGKTVLTNKMVMLR